MDELGWPITTFTPFRLNGLTEIMVGVSSYTLLIVLYGMLLITYALTYFKAWMSHYIPLDLHGWNYLSKP